MAASTMAASLVQTRVSVRTAAPTQRRTALVVRAEATEPVSRRTALAAVAGVFGALSLATGGAAEAKTKIAYQDSLQKGGSSTAASMSGYGMEGTKKRGLSPSERKEYLKKFKESITPGK